MAYNPFDDVILDDPAYMANGGPLPRPKIGIEFPNAPQQEEEKPFTLEDALQEAFNMIKENNERLLEMRKS